MMPIIKIIRKISLASGIIGVTASGITIYQFLFPFLEIELDFDSISLFFIEIIFVISVILFSYGLFNQYRKWAVSKSINRQIDLIDDVKQRRREVSVIEEWRTSTAAILRNFFGEDSANHRGFLNISYHVGIGGLDENAKQSTYESGLEQARGFLRACINELKQKF